jgi:hypothetical protein
MNTQELIKYYTLKLDLLDKKEKLGFVFPVNYRSELVNKLDILLGQKSMPKYLQGGESFKQIQQLHS